MAEEKSFRLSQLLIWILFKLEERIIGTSFKWIKDKIEVVQINALLFWFGSCVNLTILSIK
jgi:hypothetical protein